MFFCLFFYFFSYFAAFFGLLLIHLLARLYSLYTWFMGVVFFFFFFWARSYDASPGSGCLGFLAYTTFVLDKPDFDLSTRFQRYCSAKCYVL